MENGITEELARLKILQGADFIKQLKSIAARKEFHPLDTDPDIFTVGGENDADYQSLLLAARKAVEHGYKVYILPNPHDFRTADFIFERKNVFKMFDLKNISGRAVAGSRLLESVGQSNRVVLNMSIDYNPSSLARAIRNYKFLRPAVESGRRHYYCDALTTVNVADIATVISIMAARARSQY